VTTEADNVSRQSTGSTVESTSAALEPVIPRVARLTAQLWTGGGLPGRTDAARKVVEVWRNVGIRAVVDTRAEWSDEDVVAEVAPEIVYLDAGVVDGGQAMPDSWFETITAFATRHLATGDGVLVHCHSGLNRGPTRRSRRQ
jgi:dual specificity phosphatase 3